MRKFVAKPSATVFISPDLPSLSTSLVRITFTLLRVPPCWTSLSAEVGGRTLIHDPASQARLEARVRDRISERLQRLRDPLGRPPQRAWHDPPDARDVLIVGGARDAGLLELLVEELLVETVEEDLGGEGHDDQVVELAQQRHAVRDDVAPEEDVAQRHRECR